MSGSNFSELRRIRTEMSEEAGHSVRRFVETLEATRIKFRDQLVNHGAEAELAVEIEPVCEPVSKKNASGAMR